MPVTIAIPAAVLETVPAVRKLTGIRVASAEPMMGRSVLTILSVNPMAIVKPLNPATPVWRSAIPLIAKEIIAFPPTARGIKM
ncbi:MAG: hypothetical protein A2Z14_04325 [Chloroflexi bacterium RBG_16_48_8]|nr:MAG: hypothetical protein A2Z14_04325 [Chloroflexi bacterium RBG_16_48_8]